MVWRDFCYAKFMIDISKITDYLYVGSCMRQEQAEEIKVLKFDLIISMIGQLRLDEIYTKPPFNSIWIRTFDTFLTPISNKKLMIGVNAALPIINATFKDSGIDWNVSITKKSGDGARLAKEFSGKVGVIGVYGSGWALARKGY